MIKVSVIIPIYGVEKFIARCVESLFRQTLPEIEYIFVDDATPDNSMKVLHAVIERHPERSHAVRILRHEQNKGLPAARNTGLAAAQGEYIFHCDSDDFTETKMLEELYDTASRHDADVVWCDYYISHETSERYMKQPCYATPEEALKGMLCGRMKYNVWNKLVRRQLYVDNTVSFPSGYAMGEDLTMIKVFAAAKNVTYLPKAYYHYVQWNASSITREYTDNHLSSLRHNSEKTIAFLKKRYGEQWNQDIYSFALLMKWPFIVSDKRKMYRLWKDWFPEANAYIWSDKQVSVRIRFIEWCAAKGWFPIIWLHYWIVVKFFYSIAYK